ncbi:DUF1353 domain-containing protein [Helicobacter anatolicus]|uniref:DUF1353 domain-containing protein n=1 Tax=Helicobacter anatolicus TaxID=2905874 RepID=UPI001E343678|nr:DUF1353 domain-containing protein [Helicobacter anatolicus]MCE3040473.1 DUF1353 domain-containing protein [Helicobacter anatolicus]
MQEYQKFTSPIICEISNNGKIYTLKRGFIYYRKDKNNEIIEVPEGFESDGFTNFGFSIIIPKFGRGLKCAILHDFLCEKFHQGRVSRKFADDVFLEAMLETKAFKKSKAYFLYFCVRTYAFFKGFL